MPNRDARPATALEKASSALRRALRHLSVFYRAHPWLSRWPGLLAVALLAGLAWTSWQFAFSDLEIPLAFKTVELRGVRDFEAVTHRPDFGLPRSVNSKIETIEIESRDAVVPVWSRSALPLLGIALSVPPPPRQSCPDVQVTAAWSRKDGRPIARVAFVPSGAKDCELVVLLGLSRPRGQPAGPEEHPLAKGQSLVLQLERPASASAGEPLAALVERTRPAVISGTLAAPIQLAADAPSCVGGHLDELSGVNLEVRALTLSEGKEPVLSAGVAVGRLSRASVESKGCKRALLRALTRRWLLSDGLTSLLKWLLVALAGALAGRFLATRASGASSASKSGVR